MKENNKQIGQMLALITQVGIGMLAPILLCVFAGQFINDRFSVDLTLALLILGILAGCRNSYRLLSGVLQKEQRGKNDPGEKLPVEDRPEEKQSEQQPEKDQNRWKV